MRFAIIDIDGTMVGRSPVSRLSKYKLTHSIVNFLHDADIKYYYAWTARKAANYESVLCQYADSGFLKDTDTPQKIIVHRENGKQYVGDYDFFMSGFIRNTIVAFSEESGAILCDVSMDDDATSDEYQYCGATFHNLIAPLERKTIGSYNVVEASFKTFKAKRPTTTCSQLGKNKQLLQIIQHARQKFGDVPFQIDVIDDVKENCIYAERCLAKIPNLTATVFWITNDGLFNIKEVLNTEKEQSGVTLTFDYKENSYTSHRAITSNNVNILLETLNNWQETQNDLSLNKARLTFFATKETIINLKGQMQGLLLNKNFSSIANCESYLRNVFFPGKNLAENLLIYESQQRQNLLKKFHVQKIIFPLALLFCYHYPTIGLSAAFILTLASLVDFIAPQIHFNEIFELDTKGTKPFVSKI